MKQRVKLFLAVGSLVAFGLLSSAARAIDPEFFRNLGNVYWDGGEDVTYDHKLQDLIPLSNYDNSSGPTLQDLMPPPIVPKHANPVIAIVIDDMGVNRAMSSLAVESLAPYSITFSYLPYAGDVQEQADKAIKSGYEVMLHLPWEPDKESADAGPNKLLVSDSKEQIKENLLVNLNKFSGYVGINNHMGSKFSLYHDGIEIVMEELKKRNLFFLDSVTTADSIAENIAHENAIPASHRNVFLDHKENEAFVKAALEEVERVAWLEGSAIAIGHPKKITLDTLKEWLPTLEKRGFKVVKLSKVIAIRNASNIASHP